MSSLALAVVVNGLMLAAADPPGYWSQPQGDYASRAKEFLEFSAGANSGGLYSQISKLVLDKGPLDLAPIDKAIDTITTRKDGADFVANGLIRIYQSPSKLVTPELRQKIKTALLGMRYWVDEPAGKDLMSMWSENHQINYHAAQFLAGELLSGETFTNNGKPGRWHAAAGRRRVLKWIDVKAKTGFTEWDSNNCFINTSAALMNLAELAKDPVVAKRAAMILDVMFFDIAVDSFRGSYGTPHGRTYPRAIVAGGATEDTTGLQRVAWGLGAMGKPDNVAVVYLASSKRYRVARTIEALAQVLPDEVTNKERQSLRIADARRFGLNFDDPEDFFLLSGAGKYSTPEYLERSLKVIDKVKVYRYGLVMRPYAEALLATYKELAKQGKPVTDLDNQSLERMDKVTFRTPDYQLSTVQDYRKGRPGSQQHIWQATLGPDTGVFTINPGGTPKYWQGRLPRNAQHRNVLVAVYDVPAERPPGPKTVFPPDAAGDAVPSPAPSEEALLPRTLAVFRRSSFDEVVQKGNWTFGRRGRGYIASVVAQQAELVEGRVRRRGAGGRGAQERLGGADGAREGGRVVRRLGGQARGRQDQLHRVIGGIRGARRGHGELRLGGTAAGGRAGDRAVRIRPLREPLGQGAVGAGALSDQPRRSDAADRLRQEPAPRDPDTTSS